MQTDSCNFAEREPAAQSRPGFPTLKSAHILGMSLLALSLLATSAESRAGLHDNRAEKWSPEKIYHNYCSVCHGDKGDGKSRAQGSFVTPPRDFTAPESKSLPRDYMVATVRDGKPGTAMVGWKTQLNDQQIEAVVDYIRSAFMGLGSPPEVKPGEPAKPAAQPPAPALAQRGAQVAVDMKLPFPGGLIGNAAKGRDFYMQNCATCHGTLGDGQGPRAYFINPKPRNFLLAESRNGLNRPAIFTAVAKGKLGTEMPAWEKVLSQQEIANVSEFVFQQFIQPKAESATSDKSRK